MFSHRFRYYFALLLSLYTYANTEFCRLYYYFDLQIKWYYALGTIIVITFAVLEVNRLLEPFIQKNPAEGSSPIKIKIVFFAISSIAATLITTLIVFFMGSIVHSFPVKDNLIPLKLNLTYCWLLNLLFHLINTIIFYFKEYKSTRLEAEQLKATSAQAELQLIKSQINPHFLFNNLNVLASLILQKNEEANRFVEEFSKVYRYILANHEQELVELKTEFDYIKPYLFLLEKRFGQSLIIHMDIEEHQLQKLIVPACIQILVENAIKHNVVSRNKPLTIAIHTNGNDTIVVRNSLQQKQSIELSTGIGLNNIRKRYTLVSKRNIIIEKSNDTFSVTLPLINKN